MLVPYAEGDVLLWLSVHLTVFVAYGILQEERTTEKLRKRVENGAYLVAYALLAYSFGRQEVWEWPTLVSYCVGLVGFDLLGRLPFMKNSLRGIGEWTPAAFVVYGTAGILVCAAIGYHVFLSVGYGTWPWYVGCLVFVGLMNCIGLLLPMEGQCFLILSHHWQIGLQFLIFARFAETVSRICAGIACAVFVHGLSV